MLIQNKKEKQLNSSRKTTGRFTMDNYKKTGGITLIEMLIIVAIVGILAVVTVPAVIKYIRKAKMAGSTDTDSAVAKSQSKPSSAAKTKTTTKTEYSKEFMDSRRYYRIGRKAFKQSYYYHNADGIVPWNNLKDKSLCAILTVINDHRGKKSFHFSNLPCTLGHIKKARQQHLFYSGKTPPHKSEAPIP